MNFKLGFALLLLLFLSSLQAQEINDTSAPKQKFTLSGTVTDSKSNETLIGVNVYIS